MHTRVAWRRIGREHNAGIKLANKTPLFFDRPVACRGSEPLNAILGGVLSLVSWKQREFGLRWRTVFSLGVLPWREDVLRAPSPDVYSLGLQHRRFFGKGGYHFNETGDKQGNWK